MEPKENRIRKSIYFDTEQYQRLAERSRETGAPIAEMIRRAVDRYLKELTEEE